MSGFLTVFLMYRWNHLSDCDVQVVEVIATTRLFGLVNLVSFPSQDS
jgi:hypothetical protein